MDQICELAAIVLLAMASVYDLRERTIPDKLWVIGSALGITMKLLNHDQTIQFISKAWPFLLIL
ncbi:MAG: prepilin peptidase, partial [Candidatus Korarchaeum sp.]